MSGLIGFLIFVVTPFFVLWFRFRGKKTKANSIEFLKTPMGREFKKRIAENERRIRIKGQKLGKILPFKYRV